MARWRSAGTRQQVAATRVRSSLGGRPAADMVGAAAGRRGEVGRRGKDEGAATKGSAARGEAAGNGVPSFLYRIGHAPSHKQKLSTQYTLRVQCSTDARDNAVQVR